MRSLSPLLQLPFPPFTRPLGGWMQGGGRSPPTNSSVHFAWRWVLRNSATVLVCIAVSPSPSAGLSSLGTPSTSKTLGVSGAGDPVPAFQRPSSTRMPSKEDCNHSHNSRAVSVALCLLLTCIVNVILPWVPHPGLASSVEIWIIFSSKRSELARNCLISSSWDQEGVLWIDTVDVTLNTEPRDRPSTDHSVDRVSISSKQDRV